MSEPPTDHAGDASKHVATFERALPCIINMGDMPWRLSRRYLGRAVLGYDTFTIDTVAGNDVVRFSAWRWQRERLSVCNMLKHASVRTRHGLAAASVGKRRRYASKRSRASRRHIGPRHRYAL